ncbi:MAG: AAA family ATPase [Prevotella sp.]|nr:AAA family ATPase [Prevotella sp.]
MLDRIIIEGYKSIKRLDLTLRPINIFIGSNGVGKTNFISFFRLVNNIYEQRLGNYTMRHRSESLLHYGLKNTEDIKGYLRFSDNAYAFTLQSKNNGSMFIAEESSYYQDRPYTIMNIDESQIKDSTTFRDKWLRAYLDSYKIYHFHDTSEGAPLRTEAVLNDTRILRTDGGNLPAFLYMLQQQNPKTLKRLEMIIQSVMPYFERFDLHPLPSGDKIELVWNDVNAPDKYFSANDLSDGSIRFMALATLLMQPVLPKVIIIDEPELGLHPVAITKLSGLIKSAAARGCQIIISTQSVNLISNFEAEDVITVDRQNGQSVFNRLDSKELEKWLNDYSLGDLWTKSIINGQPHEL